MRKIITILVIIGFTTSVRSADPIIGTWKLNPAMWKSLNKWQTESLIET